MADWQEHSLGAAPQISGFGTVNTNDADFVYLQGDKPKVQFATEITELSDLMTGVVGAAPERLVGRRHGTLTFTIPLEGMKTGYDPAGGDDPGDIGVLPPWVCMVANILGSHISSVANAVDFWKGLHLSLNEYTAAGVASAISTAITMDNATASDKVAVGELVLTALSATTPSVQMGFAKDKTGQVITLFEAAGNTVNDAAANVYGTGTGWLSVAHPNQLPMTFRWVGENTEAAYILSDAVATSFKLVWESGAVPFVELAYSFHNFTVDKTKGGLHIPTPYARIPQIVGTNNGRAMLGTSLKCGLESCSIEYKTEISELKCHSASQGISGVSYRKPRINVSVSLPWLSTDAVYDAAGSAGNTGSYLWQSYLERGTTTSLGVYVGSNVGRCFAFLVPSARIVAVPQVAELNGAVGYQLSFEAGSYTADTTDTAETSATSPLDSLFRLSVG